MKDLLDTIYPRSDKPDYVVRLEPIQSSTKAVFQYITTEEELARYPSHTPRWEIPPHANTHHSFLHLPGSGAAQAILSPPPNLSSRNSRSSLNLLELLSSSRQASCFASARESPVTCEGETVEAPEDNQPNQQAGAESHGSPGQYRGLRRWDAEEESKAEQTQHEDEGSTSGVGDCRLHSHVQPNTQLASHFSFANFRSRLKT